MHVGLSSGSYSHVCMTATGNMARNANCNHIGSFDKFVAFGETSAGNRWANNMAVATGSMTGSAVFIVSGNLVSRKF